MLEKPDLLKVCICGMVVIIMLILMLSRKIHAFLERNVFLEYLPLVIILLCVFHAGTDFLNENVALTIAFLISLAIFIIVKLYHKNKK